MNGGSVLFIHFVELIDQTDSFIGQNKSSSFQRPLLSDWVSVHSRSETNGTCSLTSGIDDSWEDLFNVLEELRLGCSWVSEKKAINISSNFMLSSNIFWNSSKHSQSDGFLDELVSKDGRSYRLKDYFSDVWFLRKGSDLLLVLVGQLNDIFVSETFDVVGLDGSVEHWEAVLDVSAVVKPIDKDSCDFNFITWSCCVNKVVLHNDFLLSWHSSSWYRAWSLLNGPLLEVSVDALVLLELIAVP